MIGLLEKAKDIKDSKEGALFISETTTESANELMPAEEPIFRYRPQRRKVFDFFNVNAVCIIWAVIILVLVLSMYADSTSKLDNPDKTHEMMKPTYSPPTMSIKVSKQRSEAKNVDSFALKHDAANKFLIPETEEVFPSPAHHFEHDSILGEYNETYEIYQNDPAIEFVYPSAWPPWSKQYNFNGLYSNETLIKKETWDGESEFIQFTSQCSYHKSCIIPLPLHVLRKGEFGCEEIMPLLETIRDCVHEDSDDCKHYLNNGYWRDVFQIEFEGKPVVLKTLKKEHVKPREIVRQARESILLGFLEESEYVVRELGHCNVTDSDPDFGHTLMTLRYSSNMEEHLRDPEIYKTLTLDDLLTYAIQMTEGLNDIHNIPHGPYIHFDLQPRQFMLDEDNNVYINDFNRGKFIPVRYNHEGKLVQCPVCSFTNKGPWRSPEEYAKGEITEKLDIYSMGNIYWSLFNDGSKPFEKIFQRKEIYKKVRAGYRPKMSENMPPQLQKLIYETWKHNSKQRPTSQEVLSQLKEIKNNYAEYKDLNVSDLKFRLTKRPDKFKLPSDVEESGSTSATN